MTTQSDEILSDELLDCCLHDLVKKYDILAPYLQILDFYNNCPKSKGCLLTALAYISNKVAHEMMKYADADMILFTMTGDGAINASALHFAVANGMVDLVRQMLSKLNQNDRNKLFALHMGESFGLKMTVPSIPVVIACWCCDPEMLDVLLSYGAELDAREHHCGNTILHNLVELGRRKTEAAKSMFEAVFRSEEVRKWFAKKKDLDASIWTAKDDIDLKRYLLYLENEEGYTPLTWAAKQGITEMMDFIINIDGVHRLTCAQFGTAKVVYYDMAEIDTVISWRVRPGKPCVTQLLAYQKIDPVSLPSFSLPVIENLLAYKWRAYVFNVIIMCMFHAVTLLWCYQLPFLTPNGLESQNYSQNFSLSSVSLRNVMESSVIVTLCTIFSMSYIITCVTGEFILIIKSLIMLVLVATRKWHGFMYKAPFCVIFWFDFYRILGIIFSLSLGIFYLHAICYSKIALIWSGLSFLTGCFGFMFSLQVFSLTAYFGTVMHHAVFHDMISFAFVFIVAIVGYGGATTILLYNPVSPVEGFESIFESALTMVRLMTGLSSYLDFKDHKYGSLINFLVVSFVCFAVILLLNMLIAAMNDTYSKFICFKHEICIRNRASFLLYYELLSVALYYQLYTGKYMTYLPQYDAWCLVVETIVPATCVNFRSSSFTKTGHDL